MSDQNPPESPYATPAPAQDAQTQTPAHPGQADGTGGVIPYKNPKALTAYYLGVFSLIPCLGLPLAIGAIVLAVMGLKARNRNPIIKGHVHAWVGIGCAVASLSYHAVLFGLSAFVG